MNIHYIDDMVYACSGDLGEAVPAHLAGLPPARLRYVDGQFVDAQTLGTFYVAAHGAKHAVPGNDRQQVACAWDQPLLRDGDTWRAVTDADLIAAAKQAAVARLSRACSDQITAGFVSDALGAPHHYPARERDQINLMGSVTASLLPGLPWDWSTPFWCQDAAGAWAFRPHSAGEIQTAGADGKAHVLECQTTLQSLTNDVMAAETVESVAAIAWPGL